jgi:two-component system LytT family response regulator
MNPSIIRAIVVDDDPFSRQQVEVELKRAALPVAIIAQGADGREGAELVRELRPELVFLDVQMPGMDGFAMLDALGDRELGVIFITSFDQYAIRAIRYSALDYLLKPIRPAELAAAVQRYQEQRTAHAPRLKHLLGQPRERDAPPDSLVIVTRQGDRTFHTREIVRCEADRNYTWFHLTGGRRELSSYPLANYEQFLASNEFLRIHRSHIVNARHVEAWTPEGLVRLSDSTELEVSRRRRAEVVEALRALRL